MLVKSHGKYASVSDFVACSGRIGIAKVHNGSQVCTDHYNDLFSYLVHIVCLIAKDDKTTRERCMGLLNELLEAYYLDMNMIKVLYPDIFDK